MKRVGKHKKERSIKDGFNIQYSDQVRLLSQAINLTEMEDFLLKYSQFPTKFFLSKWSHDASEWLYNYIQLKVKDSNYTGKAEVSRFEHLFDQNSIIVRIDGKDEVLKKEIVILGSHLDSINDDNPIDGAAPGMDDNASGMACNLQVLNIILKNNIQLKRSLEFHFYAAEEVGLLGSYSVAYDYFKKDKKVTGMIQMDMIGHLSKNNAIAIINDYTDKGLNLILAALIQHYLDYSYTIIECGYECSDHAAWDFFGFPSSFPTEDYENPFKHTKVDDLSHINLIHFKEFTKLALAFAVELSIIR
ncbi:Zn-dependent exopeptidase [Neoconidiobolus thromboides FSU 785]|nr:Zn-dependent exopeptidase [Neoconidiobolus thromboides FSU 785]